MVQRGFIISEYISNPHLIEGLKYDLRVYVLVTSFDPLVIYMYEDGLARFATDKFTLDSKHYDNNFVHLTNYSVQKKSETYTQNKSRSSNNLKASKWSLKTLQRVFEEHGKDYKSVKARMKDLIIKTIISADYRINDAMKAGTKYKDICFELYGFDIIIDANLKPWILEVNISPSFSSSSPFDKNLKTKLICDALTIVGVKPTNHEKYEKDELKKLKEKLDTGLDVPQKTIKDIEAGNLDKDDVKLILDFEDQQSRNQNFELIFPVKNTFSAYTKFFAEKRYNNYLLWNHITDPLVDVESYKN